MSNIFLQVMRERMMIDRQLVETVYLPWMASMMNGNMNSDALPKKMNFEASAYGFTKAAFAISGRSSSITMDGAPSGSVAVVPIFGEFLKYGTQCAYGANEIVPAIYQAGELKNIVALVLDVDSGGGSESAVPPFIEAIKYVQSKGKPVVLHGDMCASAAYYIASYCDYIMVDNEISSAFGSIGVYVAFVDYKEQLEKAGVKHRTIYAPQSDMKNEEYRALVDDGNEQPLIDNVLIPSATRFINTVKQNRMGKINENSDAYRGKLFEGISIVSEGLADGFGTLYDALEVASGMAMMRRG